MSRVRVGCIGAGWWATVNHFPILAARDDVELVAICRPDRDLLLQVQKTFGFRYAFEDYRELLSLDLDAVVITTPHHLHYEHAAQALNRPLHVLCEKPMTLQAREAWDLVAAVAQRNIHFLIPYGWHYKPFVTTAKQMLDDGGVGDIEFVQCHMASPTKAFFSGRGGVPRETAPTLVAPDPKTWQVPGHGGGYAHGQLTHSTALMFWLTRLRATEVRAIATSPGSAVDMYDAATVTFANGAIGVVSGAATLPDNDKFQ
ncbi:MAG: Gfo/Idh/MocA family oxidoreductase, partial [Gammaproteobacteria bacterium]|nr:Gfo/Idh/MocA family oxidoreductase [Gammaproteobacteria bacterium]